MVKLIQTQKHSLIEQMFQHGTEVSSLQFFRRVHVQSSIGRDARRDKIIQPLGAGAIFDRFLDSSNAFVGCTPGRQLHHQQIVALTCSAYCFLQQGVLAHTPTVGYADRAEPSVFQRLIKMQFAVQYRQFGFTSVKAPPLSIRFTVHLQILFAGFS